MTQTQIIQALVRNCEITRKNYLSNQTDDNLKEWDKWTNAIDCMVKVLNDDSLELIKQSKGE